MKGRLTDQEMTSVASQAVEDLLETSHLIPGEAVIILVRAAAMVAALIEHSEFGPGEFREKLQQLLSREMDASDFARAQIALQRANGVN